MKTCSKCKEAKAREEFYTHRACKDGLTNRCKECVKEAVNKYVAANRDVVRERNRKAGQRFREARRKGEPAKVGKLYADCFRLRNKRVTEWRKANLHIGREAQAKRRATKLRATPAWANHRYVAIWYKLAAEEAERLGEPVEVDHIVPLTHPRVCGLHNEHNLQLLRLSENRAKCNRFWPDM